MIKYRKANLNDIDLLTKIRVEFLNKIGHANPEDTKTLYDSNFAYFKDSMERDIFVSWLAFDSEKLVGTTGLSFYTLPPSIFNHNGKNGYIANIYVLEKYRGQGIAKKLFSLLIDEAKSHDCARIYLNATDMGKPLYKKFGFEDTKGEMVWYVNGNPGEH